MSGPLDDVASYSAYIYALADRHPGIITNSTLTVVFTGATLGKLEGRIDCKGGIFVEVLELIDFAEKKIRTYSYEIYRGDEKMGWYDAWPHPDIPSLAATFPHHKHILPNLRENRVPAPGISFTAPNLDVVLHDVNQQASAV